MKPHNRVLRDIILYLKGPDYEYWDIHIEPISISTGWAIWHWSNWMQRGGEELATKRQREYDSLVKQQKEEDTEKARVGEEKWAKAEREKDEREREQIEKRAQARKLTIQAGIEECRRRQIETGKKVDAKLEKARVSTSQALVEENLVKGFVALQRSERVSDGRRRLYFRMTCLVLELFLGFD